MTISSVTGDPAPGRDRMTPQDQLVQCIEPWFDHVRTWVEVHTGQDLDPNHKVFDAVLHGVGLTFIEPPGDDALALTATTPRVRPLLQAEWLNALKATADGNEPPLEELFSRDARAAHRRDSYRRAVIDAACAVEVTLSRVIRSQAAEIPEPQAKRPTDRVMLGTLINIAELSSLDFSVPFGKLNDLNRARIDALHHGLTPSAWDCGTLVQIAIDFLGSHGVYKRSASNESDGSEWTVSDT